MNCCRCKKTIRTPDTAYPVQVLVDKCRRCCLGCNPEHLPHGANGFTHLGDIDPAALPIAADFAASRRPSDPVSKLSDEAEDAVRKLLATIAALDRDELTIMHGLLNGRSYSQIAETIGVKSKQLVLYRVKQVVERHPWMNALRCREAANATPKGR